MARYQVKVFEEDENQFDIVLDTDDLHEAKMKAVDELTESKSALIVDTTTGELVRWNTPTEV